jgi:hypothetical protein
MSTKRPLSWMMIAAVLATVPAVRAGENRPSWGLKLLGGAWFGPNGDVRTYWRAYDQYYQSWADAHGYAKSGAWDWPGPGSAFGGEISRSLGSRLSLGLAVERLSKNHAGSFSLGNGESDRLEMKLSAVSAMAIGRYSLPLRKDVSLFFQGGVGALFASLDRTLETGLGNGLGVLVTGGFNASGFTGRAGAGLEWSFGSQFALQLEGGYRLAALTNWSGDDVHDWGTGTARHNGTVYYVNMQLDPEKLPAVYYPDLILGDPTLGTRVVAFRKFKADFTGFCLRLGALFRF